MSKIKTKVTPNQTKKVKSTKMRLKAAANYEPTREELSRDAKNEESESSSEDELEAIVNYKKTLEDLKDKDSEFYEFLQKNDKQLLDFDISDEEVDEESDLDIDSNEKGLKNEFSIKIIDELSEKLRQKSDIEAIKSVVRSFRRVVEQTDGQKEDHTIDTEVFNAIVNLCLIDLLPAIFRLLKLPPIGSNEATDGRTIDPTKARNWKKVIAVMKCYLTDVVKMVSFVSDDSLKSSLLRHILHLVPFIIRFPHLIKKVLKQTIVLWSESNETNRILAFICILRLIRTQDQPMISFILKKLYISYVKNSKFTTEENQSVIDFMRRSLVELYSLDHFVAYQHSFIFIRQLAISLRTAMTLKKKESYRTVYNWQFLHSIRLWTQLMCSHNTIEELKPLICPLVNVIIGTIRLIPSPKLFPMRFHLIDALIKLSEETNTLIPVLPLITEALDHLDAGKNSVNSDQKAVNLDSVVKVSQMKSSDCQFRIAVVNKVYDLILHYLSTQSHRISFPELVYVTTIKIRKFLKCSNSSQSLHSLKQLVEKIEENSNFITDKRKTVEFGVGDSLSISAWERELRSDGTPLSSFFGQRQRLQSVSSPKADIDLKSLAKENAEDINKRKRFRNGDESEGQDSGRKAPKDRSKRRKKSKRAKKNKINPMFDSFEVNEALDMSSDESD